MLEAGPGMRSGGDPAIPARIDRRKTAWTCDNLYKNRAIFESASSSAPPTSGPAGTAVFFGSCLRPLQPQSIASSRAVYYNSMSVKPWGRACGDAYGQRR